MNKDLFFSVWSIYRQHWGAENNKLRVDEQGRMLLIRRIIRSINMRSILFCARVMNGVMNNLFLSEPDEIFKSIKDVSETCLNEEWHESTELECMEPHYRMTRGLHMKPSPCCNSVAMRHWIMLLHRFGSPSCRSFITASDDTIYRVSAIVTL